MRAAETSPALWFDSVDVPDLRRRRGVKWAKYGPDTLAAWVADMDFPPAPPVREVLADMVEAGDLGYGWLGEPNAVAVAFARWAERRHGWAVDPASVVLTTDVLQPLQALVDLHAAPGEGVVVQTPIYPPFLQALEMTGRRLVDHPLGPAAEGYPLDVEALPRLVGGGARVLLLCNPHNPSGRVLRRDELDALARAALEHDLVVVADEIHADLVYDGHRHIPFASLGADVAARTVTLTSASKTFSFAGLRAALAVFGSPELKARYETIPPYLLGRPATPGTMASVAAWERGDEWVDALVRYLDGNRRHVEAFVAEHLPGVSHRAPEATYLAWLDCRELVASGRCEDPAAFFLERARVALNDGRAFGAQGTGFVRLNFGTSRRVLDQVLGRMAEALA
ncbi:MAG: putative C-S lyase [Acidimicrobiia bacterium]|nr:putative C-S lyase [Acidimicrobiia bacterium]